MSAQRPALLDTNSYCDLLSSSKDRICQKSIQTLGLLVFNHRATDCHHERDRRIDLLVEPSLRRVQVAASVRLAHDIADAPRQHWVSVMTQPAGAHRCVEFDDSGAE